MTEVFNFLPSLSFTQRADSASTPFVHRWGNSTHSQCLSEEIVLPPYRRMKKASIIYHLALHQCHRGGDSEFKEQGSGMLELHTQKRMFLVICHTLCMVDRSVECCNSAPGKIRSVRLFSTYFSVCICFVL